MLLAFKFVPQVEVIKDYEKLLDTDGSKNKNIFMSIKIYFKG